MALLELIASKLKAKLLPAAKEGPSLKQKIQHVLESQDPEAYSEIKRICALPIMSTMTKEEVSEFTRKHALASAYNSGWRFFEPQAAAIWTYLTWGVCFCPIGVGWGKTLITLMIASKAYEKGLKKIMLLVPAQVYSQLVNRDIQWARSKVTLSVPFIGLGNKDARSRLALATRQMSGCYIIPYSCMSTKDTTKLIDLIKPELIILDEAHYLKNRYAARSRRVMSYVEKHKPELVCLSGTITNKSVIDYWHLITHSLHNRSPLPLSKIMAYEWAEVIDSNNQPSMTQTGPLQPLIEWALEHFRTDTFPINVAGFRKAFKKRLNSCPGIVCTGEEELGVSLTLKNVTVPKQEESPGWEKLSSHITELEEKWVTPNGDEIEHQIHVYKWMYELSAGFYNLLLWPDAQTYAYRKGIGERAAQNILDRARAHHKLHQKYAKELRTYIKEKAKPGLDTPFLIGSDMRLHGSKNVTALLYMKWRAMKELEFEGMPERDSIAVRVCPYKINAAVEWAKSLPRDEGAIIWVYHNEMGLWVYEALSEALTRLIIHAPAGPRHDEEIADPRHFDKIIVASIAAHGVGKNLQHHQNQIFLQWPRSATIAQQTLGRTHRNGQEADELIVNTLNTTDFDEINFAACLNDSLYIHQSTGDRQKLIYASYDPLPKIFPYQVLQEKGAQADQLNTEQQALLKEKFSVN